MCHFCWSLVWLRIPACDQSYWSLSLLKRMFHWHKALSDSHKRWHARGHCLAATASSKQWLHMLGEDGHLLELVGSLRGKERGWDRVEWSDRGREEDGLGMGMRQFWQLESTLTPFPAFISLLRSMWTYNRAKGRQAQQVLYAAGTAVGTRAHLPLHSNLS